MSWTDNNQTKHKSEHQQIWELLPWYINHSLNTIEENRAKTHVQHCIACKIELQQQQQIFDKMNQASLLQQASQISFSQLKQRIEKDPKTSKELVHDKRKGERGLEFFNSIFFSFNNFKFVASVVTVAAVLIILPSFFHASRNLLETTNAYRTLAAASPQVIDEKNNVMRVVFAESVTLNQINSIISSASGKIIKGPSKNGVYEIQIGDESISKDQLVTIVNRLRDHESIVFAELAQGTFASE